MFVFIDFSFEVTLFGLIFVVCSIWVVILFRWRVNVSEKKRMNVRKLTSLRLDNDRY